MLKVQDDLLKYAYAGVPHTLGAGSRKQTLVSKSKPSESRKQRDERRERVW